MEINRTDVVISTKGRDEGQLFLVLSRDENFIYLVNGRNRRIETPKRKQQKHMQFVCHSEGRIKEKMLSESKISNSEIRRALSEMKQAPSQQYAEEVDSFGKR